MRVRNLFASGLALIVVAACSQSNTEASLDDETLAAELELALFNGSGQQASAVTSAVELTRSQEPGTAPRVAPTTRTRTPAPATELVLAAETPVEDAAPVEEAAEIVAEVVAAPSPESVQPTGTIVAVAGGLADHAGPRDAETRGNGRGIIIRGGVGGHDPCAKHGPGMEGTGGILGVIGTLINDRTPPVRGNYPGATDRGRPDRGSNGGMIGMGGGMGGMGGGGGNRFPGGIR